MSQDDDIFEGIRADWARHVAVNAFKDEWNDLIQNDDRIQDKDEYKLKKDELPQVAIQDHYAKSKAPLDKLKVGIIGAGAAGLFTGLIFDYLQEKVEGFDVTYEIIEAAKKERVGGRLYTHRFSNDDRDYFDVGAMRFPENPVMSRVFKLFKFLGMEKCEDDSNTKEGSLIPYYIKGEGKEPWRFNGTTRWGDLEQIRTQTADTDPFNLNKEGNIPKSLLNFNPDEIMNESIHHIREKLKELKHDGWKLLMKYDSMTTRDFLRQKPDVDESLSSEKGDVQRPNIPPPPYNHETIDWLETFNGGTNWYDQAHSETVLESLDFTYDRTTSWWCVLGGSQQLALEMEKKLKKKPNYERRVVAIRAERPLEMQLDIEYSDTGDKNESPTKTYSAVFSSVPLGCLQRMDTKDAGLNYGTKEAIRSLGYGASAKIGIKFKRPWWIHELGETYNIKKGGLGHSDLMIRTCVYPSYNYNTPRDKSAVLLCSYTWQQDAQRIASLIKGDNTLEEELKEQIFRDLARLHHNDDVTEKMLYKIIKEAYEDHYAFDWYSDPNAMGAFAFFRPQQFSNMWSKIIQPSGDLVIIGEIASPRHAWVVGALESAVYGVYTWLVGNQHMIPKAKEAIDILRASANASDDPFVGLPSFMAPNLAEWQSLLARRSRDGSGKLPHGMLAVAKLS